jgi:tripartite-type tricarboxylate transporter receptor subunit TctC
MLKVAVAAALALAAAEITHAQVPPKQSAQGYPTRPLRFVVAAAPGGTPDILARIVGPKLSEQVAQPVVIDNRPGATGNIGADVVAKAPADGYTLLMATGVLAISPSFYRKLPFNPVTDLAPVTQVASQATFLFVQNDSPVKSVKDLVALAKAKPATLSYATFGMGSPQHVAGELLQAAAGVKFIHVPYKSGGLMTTALVSGEVQFMFLGLSPALPFVKSGRLRVIGVAADKRARELPEVPTLTESGVPGVVADNWLGVFTTGRTPKGLIDKLNAEIVKAVRTPDTSEKITQQGLDIVASSPAEFSSFYRAELAKIQKLVKTAGIEPQ